MKAKLIKLFLITCVFSANAPVFAKNPVLHYEPEIVKLTGIIKIKTYPGAPGYERIEAGDDIESGPYLILDHPVDVVTSANDAPESSAIDEKNQRIMQIVSGDERDNWDDKYIGKHVRVTGVLSHQIFGHHHTTILISAKHFEMLKK